MRKIASTFLIIILLIVLTGCGTNINNKPKDRNDNQTLENENISQDKVLDEKPDENRILVLYFGMSGNTETIANYIKDYTNADIMKLEPVKAYPTDLEELYKIGKEELDKNARPELKTKVDLSKYDVIFIGYPIWGANLPRVWCSFFDEYDLSGKTLIPFTTHGGSGMSGTDKDIEREEPNAKVLKGFEVYGSNAAYSKNEVNNWLQQIGF